MKPDWVDGEPVCSGTRCPLKGANDLCLSRSRWCYLKPVPTGSLCVPALRQQRDDAQAVAEGVRKAIRISDESRALCDYAAAREKLVRLVNDTLVTYDCRGATGGPDATPLPLAHPEAATIDEVAEALSAVHPDHSFYVDRTGEVDVIAAHHDREGSSSVEVHLDGPPQDSEMECCWHEGKSCKCGGLAPCVHLAREREQGIVACWIPCPNCDEFWCTIHDQHAYECPCPPIEEWGDADPYRDTPEQAAARKSHQDAP